MPPRAFLFAACALLLAALSCTPTPACGSSLLLGGGSFVLERPLLLEGVNVDAALSSMQAALQTAQADIAALKLRNTQLQSELDESKQELAEVKGSMAELQATVTTQADG